MAREGKLTLIQRHALAVDDLVHPPSGVVAAASARTCGRVAQQHDGPVAGQQFHRGADDGVEHRTLVGEGADHARISALAFSRPATAASR